jgi:hypothetical protein
LPVTYKDLRDMPVSAVLARRITSYRKRAL